MKTALITGVLGQDGSYLAEYLLSLDYKVFGLTRRNPDVVPYLADVKDRITFLYGDLQERASLESAIWKSKPDEIYNFAGQVFVPISWTNPDMTFDVNVGGLARILEIAARLRPEARIYQACSSEMYGDRGGDANEETPFEPNSPYGASKLAAHLLCQVHKKAGLYVASGICFNHESPRRGHEMVTRKIAAHVAGWGFGDKSILRLGNLDSRRDWGFAGDYVKAMHLMLQGDEPKDYVIGTGESHSVGEFVDEAILAIGHQPEEFKALVSVDRRLVRKNDIKHLKADPLLVHKELGWKSTTAFRTLVYNMVSAECQLIRKVGRREFVQHA